MYGLSLGFPGSSVGKESAFYVGDLGLIPGLGRSAGEGKGSPLQDSGLENFMVCIVHGGHKKLDMTEPLSLQGLSLVAAHRLLIAVASFVAEHRL